MVQHAVGIDVVEVQRVADVLARHGDRFLARIYTDNEVAVCRGRVPELAARFAAKEATMKALGTGVRGVGWRDIEVLPNRRGKPLLLLHGRARARADAIGLVDLDISLTHDSGLAMAFVVGHAGAMPPDELVPRTRRPRPPHPTGGTP
jgi:holo-[acyl-carrier protein] synthase